MDLDTVVNVTSTRNLGLHGIMRIVEPYGTLQFDAVKFQGHVEQNPGPFRPFFRNYFNSDIATGPLETNQVNELVRTARALTSLMNLAERESVGTYLYATSADDLSSTCCMPLVARAIFLFHGWPFSIRTAMLET